MKRVVIVGGGFAGSTVARNLEKNFEVTLIDNKDYFEFTPGVLRSIVEPKHTKKIQKLHTDYLHKAFFVRGEVNKIKEGAAFIGSKKYNYDYLVLAPGSSYAFPIKEENVLVTTRASHLRNSYKELCKANSVLIVGGGLVGVELAGEIISHYPEKSLTILHARDRLIERNNLKASDAAEKFFKKRNVSIIYNEMLIGKKNGFFMTDKGNKISADLAFICTGIFPNTNDFKNTLGNFMDKKGFLLVNDFLQLKENPNIFVAGDSASIYEEKTAQNAEAQAKIVCNNILAHSKGQEMQKYGSKKTPQIISLGNSKAIFVWKDFAWYGKIPSVMKSLVEWKEMRKLR